MIGALMQFNSTAKTRGPRVRSLELGVMLLVWWRRDVSAHVTRDGQWWPGDSGLMTSLLVWRRRDVVSSALVWRRRDVVSSAHTRDGLCHGRRADVVGLTAPSDARWESDVMGREREQEV